MLLLHAIATAFLHSCQYPTSDVTPPGTMTMDTSETLRRGLPTVSNESNSFKSWEGCFCCPFLSRFADGFGPAGQTCNFGCASYLQSCWCFSLLGSLGDFELWFVSSLHCLGRWWICLQMWNKVRMKTWKRPSMEMLLLTSYLLRLHPKRRSIS